MINQTNTNLVIRSSLVLVLALAIWSPAPARSAEPAEGTMMMGGKMMERCQAMKDQKQKMMEDMKAQDAELTKQVAKMNSVPEGQKMSLMAAVVTRMVEQRTAMNLRKAKMQEEMMQHMMQHMQMGRKSMSQCPMMKGMKDMDETPGAGQQEQIGHKGESMLVKLSTDKTVSETADALQVAVQANHFGVMQVHNLKETMTKKGVEFARECLIFEVCQPQQAKKVLDKDMSVSAALPCRISVYEEGGKTILATLKPTALLAMFNTPQLKEVAQEVEDTIALIMKEAAAY